MIQGSQCSSWSSGLPVQGKVGPETRPTPPPCLCSRPSSGLLWSHPTAGERSAPRRTRRGLGSCGTGRSRSLPAWNWRGRHVVPHRSTATVLARRSRQRGYPQVETTSPNPRKMSRPKWPCHFLLLLRQCSGVVQSAPRKCRMHGMRMTLTDWANQRRIPLGHRKKA